MRFSSMSVVCCLLIAACGGGGSGGGGSADNNSQMSSTPLVLTGANYESVSRSVLDGNDSLSTFSSSGATLGAEFVTASVVETPPAWMPALVSQVKKIKSWSTGQFEVLSGVEASASEACEYGGSLSVSVNDANDNDALDAGDSITVSFANCGISDLERANGNMSFMVNSFSNGYYLSLDVSMSLSNFSVVSGNISASGSGDMRLTMSESSKGTTYSISGSRLTSSTTVLGETTSVIISDYTMGMNDALTGTDQHSLNATVAMSSFSNQSVAVSTISPWLQSNGALYPYAGQMLLTGRSGSKVRITALSSSSVRLELDASGDGVYETSKVVTWASLQ